jgi:hypothetical protein
VTVDCRYYDNDEVMASLGRQVVDQYIGLVARGGKFDDLRGPASYIIATIEEYTDEDDSEEYTDEDDSEEYIDEDDSEEATTND